MKVSKRKLFGQHFLTDQKVINHILDSVGIALEQDPVENLIEIGPGKGALTLPFLERMAFKAESFTSKSPISSQTQLTIIEKDDRFAKYWSEYQALNPKKSFSIVHSDFLLLNDQKWLGFNETVKQGPTHLLPRTAIYSNLPYSVGTAIFSKIAAYPDQVAFMVLMFQAEVAQRIRAEQGTKAWGSLSVWAQNLWNIELLTSVAPRAFEPPPKVQSEVIVLRPRQLPLIPGTLRNPLWEKMLKIFFAHRRKMLRSGLPDDGPWRNALEHSKVDATKRAEALTWIEWKGLYESLQIVTQSK